MTPLLCQNEVFGLVLILEICELLIENYVPNMAGGKQICTFNQMKELLLERILMLCYIFNSIQLDKSYAWLFIHKQNWVGNTPS